jgi:hypothetical protein
MSFSLLAIFPFTWFAIFWILVFVAGGVACSRDEDYERRMKLLAEAEQPVYHEMSALPSLAVVWILLSVGRLATLYFDPQSYNILWVAPESLLLSKSSEIVVVIAMLFTSALAALLISYLGVELARMQKAGTKRDR